jgi:hypothetical protein
MAKNSSNVLALGVGLNLDPLNQDIATAAKTAKEGMNVVAQSVVDAGSKSDKPLRETKDKLISLSAQLRQARLDAQQLSQGGKELGDAFQASVSKAAALKDQIAAVDNAIVSNTTTIQNQGQPAFKNATNGYNGMAMSINQLTREMPAFTYSMQTGFMAISNNIPMFIDQINMAKKANMELMSTGQPVKSVFSQVASSLFSFQTLMGVGITLLTVYGAKIYEYIAGNLGAVKSIKEQQEALEKLNNERAKEFDFVNKNQNEKKKIAELDLRLMKDGLAKQLEASRVASVAEYDENYRAFKIGERTALDYNKVKNRIKEFYINESLRITTDFNKKEADELEKSNNEKNAKQDKYAKAALALTNKNYKDLADLNKKLSTQDLLNAFKGPKDATSERDKNGLIAPQFIPITYQIRTNIDTQEAEFAIKQATENIKARIANLIPMVKEAIAGIVGNALSGLGEAIAGALSGDEDPFEAFGVMLIKSLGQMAVQLGTELLAIGTAMLFVPPLQASAAGYLLGGAALIVAGSAVSGLAGRKSGGSTQTALAAPTPTSDFNGNGSNYLGGNNSGNIVINGMIKGNDIQLVNGRNDRKFNRSLRFG